MDGKMGSYFHRRIRPDFTKIKTTFTDEESAAIATRMAAEYAGFDARARVAYVRAHPEEQFHWNAGIMSFEEYARCVEAGEFD